MQINTYHGCMQINTYHGWRLFNLKDSALNGPEVCRCTYYKGHNFGWVGMDTEFHIGPSKSKLFDGEYYSSFKIKILYYLSTLWSPYMNLWVKNIYLDLNKKLINNLKDDKIFKFHLIQILDLKLYPLKWTIHCVARSITNTFLCLLNLKIYPTYHKQYFWSTSIVL